MEKYIYAKTEEGLSLKEIKEALLQTLKGRILHKVLIIPPDFTRFHSNAGYMTNIYYHDLINKGCIVDILSALGTHEPMTETQIKTMFGDISSDKFIPHNWRMDVVRLGEIPANYLEEITEGFWHESIDVEINRMVMDESYDLIISLGQVVPHEVVGMAGHAKNLFVGVGGSDMINKSHMLGAVYGMERIIGKDHMPVRKILDYGMEHFLHERPVLFVLTVCTISEKKICTHGLFIGEDRECLEKSIELAKEKNIDFVETGIKKCVVYLEPSEFKTTWLGNKAVYRARMAIADGGELLVLAPGLTHFGEDKEIDRLIRKYGYRGRTHILEEVKNIENQDLRDNMSVAAHLIHGSSEGRFKITYAVKSMVTREEMEGVGFHWADYDETIKRYNPDKLQYGYNKLSDDEEIYFIPNPALGLWINREKF